MTASPRRPGGGPWPTLTVLLLMVSWPGATGVSAQTAEVPAPSEVLGYEIGDRFTDVAGVERYMRALAEASPLVSVDTYGETVEGRPLLQVVIAAPEHRARMDEILRLNRELMDPGTSEDRAREIATVNPAILYFTYGIHGNESSSPEAAIWTAHDLASGSPEVAGVLDSVVVVMDPAANPDGRDRYVNFYRSAAQARPNTNLEIRERREPWPGGRFNHYLFDLNRDWAWLSQPETRMRLERYLRYNPQVHVDFHEMGYQTSYFFFPAARPVNPIYPGHILEWGERFGRGNARAMDQEGLLYYTRQNFDLFYPAYGDSWPSLLGAIGMTYEQAGGGFGGRQIERPDGTVLSLRDRAFGHRTTGNATLRTAMEGKSDLLLGYAAFHRNIDEGLDPAYLLVPGPDRHRSEALVGVLIRQGIEVERLAESEVQVQATPHPGFEARSGFPEGTFRVRTRQPRGRLAGALLRPENLLDATFSYDISAWALPFAYGVEAHSATGSVGGDWVPVHEIPDPLGGALPVSGPYGYLLPPSFGHARGVLRFLEDEGVVYAMADTFTIDGSAYPRGTLFFPRGRNQELDRRVEEAGLGGLVTPIGTGLADSGIDLGTNDAAPLRLPRLALLGGEGTVPTSFGAHWFFLERQLDLPFDIVNVGDVAATDLSGYDVVVVPAGNPVGPLGEGGMDALEAWIRGGGTLVAVSSAAQRLAEPLAEVEERAELEGEDPERDERLAEALRSREERELETWEERVPGTILPVTLDPGHPLAFGAGAEGGRPDRLFVLSSGVGFEPSDEFESVGYFPEGLDRISGVISEANLERLDRSAWLVQRGVGQGKVILFADDPAFRMFWYAGWPLYLNAILLAPAF
jgi:hypothetical protein